VPLETEGGSMAQRDGGAPILRHTSARSALESIFMGGLRAPDIAVMIDVEGVVVMFMVFFSSVEAIGMMKDKAGKW
jgi:hypothetical protein